jgi:hypothetical protein
MFNSYKYYKALEQQAKIPHGEGKAKSEENR